jgi:phosphonopyruvate decarboxylase
LLNNNSHESVGGQITGAEKINFNLLSRSLGYRNYYRISHNREIKNVLKKFLKNKKTSLLEVVTKLESNKKMPRPKNLIKIKNNFFQTYK